MPLVSVDGGTSRRSSGGGAVVSNPPFHPLALKLTSPLGIPKVNLERGYIKRAHPDDKGITYACNFLYNPTDVTVSHSVDIGALILPADGTDPLNTGPILGPLSSTMNFSLLFQRVFEQSQAGNVAGQGVEADVSALYYIVGMKKPKPGQNRLFMSPMVANAVYVRFGGLNSLMYYGFISGLNIAYTHWTQAMVPWRATAAMTLNMFIDPSIAAGSMAAGAAASAADLNTAHPLVLDKNKHPQGRYLSP